MTGRDTCVLNSDRSIRISASIRRTAAALGIAGSLAITSLAFADATDTPRFGDDLVGQRPLPAQARYFAERAAQLRNEMLHGDSFPPSDELIGQRPLPSQARHFEERAAQLRTATVNNDSFPPSDELIGQRPLPSQARYFEEKTKRATYANSSSANRVN